MDLTPWIASDGTVNLLPEVGRNTCDNDNGVLFRAYLGALDGGDEFQLPYYPCFMNPGTNLPDRNPGRSNDTTAFDEYLGWTYIFPYLAYNFIDYGKKHFWYFDNTGVANFSLSLWRMPAQRVVYYASVGMEVPKLDLTHYLSAKFQNCFNGENKTSDILLQWLSDEILHLRAPHIVNTPEFIDIEYMWWEVLTKRFNGFYNVFNTYFKHPEHPIRLLAGEKFKDANTILRRRSA